jgi:hypothetical protein
MSAVASHVLRVGVLRVHAARVMPKAESGKARVKKLWRYNQISGDFNPRNAGFGGILGGNWAGGC